MLSFGGVLFCAAHGDGGGKDSRFVGALGGAGGGGSLLSIVCLGLRSVLGAAFETWGGVGLGGSGAFFGGQDGFVLSKFKRRTGLIRI